MLVTGQSVADFVGQGDTPEVVALAGRHVLVVTELARSYTRGNGFAGDEPNTDVAAAITTAAARLLTNPSQVPYDVGSVSYRGGFNGWTLTELAVLNRYRVRAQ